MIKFEEVWSKVKDDTPLAVLTMLTVIQRPQISNNTYRDYQRDSTHPKWYGTDMNYLQVAKDRFMKNEGLLLMNTYQDLDIEGT